MSIKSAEAGGRRVAVSRGPSALPSVLLYAAASLLVAVLVLGATRGSMLLLLLAVGAAAFVALLAVIGAERMGYLMLIGAFGTAPMYKALAPSVGSPVTATDVLFVIAFTLLFPTLLRGHLRLPALYYVGVGLVLGSGLIASVFSADPLISSLSLFFWMAVMLGLPIAFGLLSPSPKLVDLLAAAFVAGQIFSFAYGAARGYVAQGRHAGYSTHPNYFAQAGMLSLALLIYLAYRHRDRWLFLIVPAAGLCGATVVLSGSRAATVVVAVLVLMVPVVERSALTGFLLAMLGAITLLVLPIVADIGGEGSSLSRLAGGGGSSYSDSARTLGLDEGLDRFFEHPLRGTGLIDLFDIHNNFLEVAVAIGIFGLVGYLMVLYVFARPIFGTGDYRRLSYGVWAYIGFGATVPSLYDRSVWAVMALSVVAIVEHERRRIAHGDPDAEPDADPDDPVPPIAGPAPVAPDRIVPSTSNRSGAQT